VLSEIHQFGYSLSNNVEDPRACGFTSHSEEKKELGPTPLQGKQNGNVGTGIATDVDS
jgi:hypothetical protein